MEHVCMKSRHVLLVQSHAMLTVLAETKLLQVILLTDAHTTRKAGEAADGL